MAIISECTFIDAELLKTKEVVEDFSCIGSAQTCYFVLPVFAYPTDSTDKYRNDFTATLLTLSNRYTNGAIYLDTKVDCGDWTEVAQLNDNTYGTYYNSFTGLNNWVGYKIDWRLVYNLEGAGYYRIRQEYTDTLEASNKIRYSYQYNLKLYTDDLADETVKIRYKINGGEIGSIRNQKDTVDYKTNSWEREIRIPRGFFGFPTSEHVQEFTRYRNGEQVPIENSAIENYRLTLRKVPFGLHRELNIIMMFCDEIYISDYNSQNPNPDKYNAFEVVPTSGYEPQWTLNTTYAPVSLTFKSKYENIRRKKC